MSTGACAAAAPQILAITAPTLSSRGTGTCPTFPFRELRSDSRNGNKAGRWNLTRSRCGRLGCQDAEPANSEPVVPLPQRRSFDVVTVPQQERASQDAAMGGGVSVRVRRRSLRVPIRCGKRSRT